MPPVTNAEPDEPQRFSAVMRGHGVWLYCRLPLGYRDPQAVPCERALDATDACKASHALRIRSLSSLPMALWPILSTTTAAVICL